MLKARFAIVTSAIVTFALLAGCSAQPGGDVAANPPVRGAQTTGDDGMTKVSGPQFYNSDNRSIIVRSGLNSDPNNPSGAPASPRSWNSF